MTAESSHSQGVRTEHRSYVRAPIVEVILQFDFGEPSDSQEDLRAVTADLANLYPTREEIREFAAQFQFGPEGMQATTTPNPPTGYQIKDSTGHRIVRLFEKAISVHEVQPYTGWSTFIAVAREVFAIYQRRVPRATVRRIGLRYINRIDLPHDAGDIREWLCSAPDIPAGLPQFVSSYSSEMAMPQPDMTGVVAVMRQALLDTPSPEVGPIILDIEMVCQVAVALPMLWNVVETMHERENSIFERTITDRVRGIIS